VTETYQPLPDASGTWYHAIPSANYLQQYETYVSYGGFSSAHCTYQGNNAITWCP
jgi:hypothetical protein